MYMHLDQVVYFVDCSSHEKGLFYKVFFLTFTWTSTVQNFW